MIERPRNVLFLCTGNSARSIMAESLLRRDGAGRFRAFSAGSDPRGDVHPLALAVLQESGYPTGDLRSKSWQEFAEASAPGMDIVITVCDNAAGEACPVWPGRPVAAHWGIEDPAARQGTEAEKRTAFRQALRSLKARIDRLTALSAADLESSTLGARLRDIAADVGQSAAAGTDLRTESAE